MTDGRRTAGSRPPRWWACWSPQVFNFTDSQFRAVAELPFDLLVLALVSYHLRQPYRPAPRVQPPPVETAAGRDLANHR